jgi:hypothetical protein
MSTLRQSVWFSCIVVLGCGSPAPPPATPERSVAAESEERVSSSTEGTAHSEASGEAPGKCDPGCSRLLEAAATLLRQAEALKGESQARATLHERAGEAYVKAWRGCDLGVPRGVDLGCAGARDVAANMAQGFAGAERDDRQIFAHLVALDPRYRSEGSEFARQAADQLAGLAEQAETRAGTKPKTPHAAEALAMAAYARMALGDAEKAGRDAALLRRSLARAAGEEVSLVGAALGWHYANQESWDKALGELTVENAPAPQQPARVQILWHAARGRALAGLGRSREASQEFERVLGLWRTPDPKDPGKMVGHAAPAPMLGRESVVDAVGAARFSLGEELRLRAKKLALPAYAGASTVQGVSQYVKGPVASWVAKKQSLLSSAEAHYRAIGEIKPVPPPRWLVAGAAMLGQAYADFAQDFRDAKLPPALERDTEISGAFTRAASEAEKPLSARARQSFEYCRKTAEQLGVDDANSAACRTGLGQRP